MPEIDDAPTYLSPAERTLRASIAAQTRWAKEPDRTAATAAARAAQQRRREDAVDPDHLLTPGERARRAENLHRAHMQRMALKSAQARRRRKAIAQRRKRGAA
ncbi:hypothetical protein [Mycobacterium montefiorense]|uniref:Uncharacterized protein n=1 Tax=Mycobacterium montefiorense TaxID=154654 RepID=A0AA37PSX6_9MYCO|nr:hypothetical protein [Mycobacterium montefiorense]GBG35826.1 hypothetical protein MmonteBS_01980 [Mycobacterium montefiorense]GKU35976.1 hypothetical protein NJB14191_33220 [Mycobacterium montefiorense]GKU41582.1 hypothetical protein NJB14192_35660 [Mycobacterium montefiorense]GKU44416.1 hypothetical protein NJB14194_10440 [Mycobacterium montefiorense]GKU51920.1 hypothetical protein NJB14195_31640 [Mycobacterium montefiorense]